MHKSTMTPHYTSKLNTTTKPCIKYFACRFRTTERDECDRVTLHFRRQNMLLVDELSKPEPNTEDIHFPPGYWPSFKEQCLACLWKQHCSYWKNPEHNSVRFINTFCVSIMFGIVFWKIGSTM